MKHTKSQSVILDQISLNSTVKIHPIIPFKSIKRKISLNPEHYTEIAITDFSSCIQGKKPSGFSVQKRFISKYRLIGSKILKPKPFITKECIQLPDPRYGRKRLLTRTNTTALIKLTTNNQISS